MGFLALCSGNWRATAVALAAQGITLPRGTELFDAGDRVFKGGAKIDRVSG
jgi:hypothetical protein